MTEYQAAWLIYSGALIVFFVTLAFMVWKIRSVFLRSFLLAGLVLFNAAFVIIDDAYSPLLAKIAVDVAAGEFTNVLQMLPYIAGLFAACLLIAGFFHQRSQAKIESENNREI